MSNSKTPEDTKLETNGGDNEVKDEDEDNSRFNKEENHDTNNNLDARFYNNNKEYGVVDNKVPKLYPNHYTTSTSSYLTSVSYKN